MTFQVRVVLFFGMEIWPLEIHFSLGTRIDKVEVCRNHKPDKMMTLSAAEGIHRERMLEKQHCWEISMIIQRSDISTDLK